MPDVVRCGVVVQERRTSKTDAIKVEDDVNGIHRLRPVAHFHPFQDDNVEKTNQAIYHAWVFLRYLRQTVVTIDELIKI